MRKPNSLPEDFQNDLDKAISELMARLASLGESFSTSTVAMLVLIKQLQDLNETMQKLLDERNET